ncbi:XTP/dITP diphosphatase [Promethearchaeum syntrophicum]|uniref:XTP/dITP diphosphatase n=1 Tax=Promethearchaeum syntrophicum TaxID=2594042 RepID=A0A5B9DCF4_9ARCH|nr:XTP/dITP diphosphatase [Candidatus Prometheoarchaeum syntrophicum]QEE16898.1 Non-canonical purine NTP pyrophosphatase [Candidatus Prometheoarchaeum syntrophicum]
MLEKKALRFVTGNPHKYKEVKEVIQKNFPNFEVIQSNIELLELQADSLEEVALFKVNSVKTQVKIPYFIEDAGFFVDDVCNGFPGVFSSYVMKTIGYNGILKILGDAKMRKAHFESVIAYIDEDEKVFLFKGVNYGKVSIKAHGHSGFGFDPIFISDETPGKTFAELKLEEKNDISHRRRSLDKLITFLKNYT